MNDLFRPLYQLSVTSENETYSLNIPKVPITWHHVTFTWSKAWGLKYYQDGALVAETGRSEKGISVTEEGTNGLFIIGKRVLTSIVSSADNFQVQGLTVWPRLVSQAQLERELETGNSLMLEANNLFFFWLIDSAENCFFVLWNKSSKTFRAKESGPSVWRTTIELTLFLLM